MTLMDNLGNLVGKLTGDHASDADVHAEYDRMANGIPQSTLADGLNHAFTSDQTPPFEQMVSGLYGHSNPEQKAGLLNQLLGALGPGAASQILSSLGENDEQPRELREAAAKVAQLLRRKSTK